MDTKKIQSQERCDLMLHINLYHNLYTSIQMAVYIMMQDRPVEVKRPTWRSSKRRIPLGFEDRVARDSLEEHLITSRNLPVSLEAAVAEQRASVHTGRVGDEADGVERSGARGHERQVHQVRGVRGPPHLLSRDSWTAKLPQGVVLRASLPKGRKTVPPNSLWP